MNIKNFFKALTLAIVMTIAFSYQSNAAIASTSIALPSDSTKDAEIAANIVKRVTEIDNMDKTNLSPSEKKALKKELRDMKNQADGLDKRVYLSIGAIIIIILLLILIL